MYEGEGAFLIRAIWAEYSLFQYTGTPAPRKGGVLMDLRQGKITLGEILRHPQARELLTRELPQFARSPLLGLAGGMTLNQILIHAKGRVPPEQIKRLLSQLEEL